MRVMHTLATLLHRLGDDVGAIAAERRALTERLNAPDPERGTFQSVIFTPDHIYSRPEMSNIGKFEIQCEEQGTSHQ